MKLFSRSRGSINGDIVVGQPMKHTAVEWKGIAISEKFRSKIRYLHQKTINVQKKVKIKESVNI